MPQHFIPMIMGGVFCLLGLVAYLWGRSEEKKYYNSISTRTDVKEYLEHEPRRPEPRAFKIGGWVAIAVGVLMLVMGSAFWLWG